MSSASNSDFNDMVTNFHRGVIPVVGAASAGILLFIVLLVHWKGHRLTRLVVATILFAALAQAVIGAAFIVSMVWVVGVQLALSALFGVYAGLSRHPDVLIVNTFVGLFNLLALLGRLSWFSYNQPLYAVFDVSGSFTSADICRLFYGIDSWDDTPFCEQYQTALRFASYLVIFIVAGQTFLSYALAKIPRLHETLGEAIDDPVVGQEGYGYKRNALY